jgi:general secretion pathway protein G
MFKKGNRGFTLIELLVVIAIIGILSSVVLASLNTARRKARDSRRISDIQQIQLALELYFDSCRTYPPTGTGNVLTASATDTSCPSGTTFGSFMSSVPVPPAGADAVYTYVRGTATTYCLGTTLEDSGADPDGDAQVACGALTAGTAGVKDTNYTVTQ